MEEGDWGLKSFEWLFLMLIMGVIRLQFEVILYNCPRWCSQGLILVSRLGSFHFAVNLTFYIMRNS